MFATGNLVFYISFLKEDLQILASFLSVKCNAEDVWNKPMLNR